MAISTDTTFNLTRDQIIQDALITLGARYPGESVDDNTNQFATRMLNRMLLAWQAHDLHLWLETEATLFTQQNQYIYSFTNATAGDHCTNAYVEATITTTVTSGSSIILSTVTGMSVGDNIGVILYSGSTTWTTINAINTGTLTVTLNSAITSQASANNFVHTYTNKIVRPLVILQARNYLYNAAVDTLMIPMARTDYFSQPSKTSLGTINQYYYDPQLTTGKFYVWQNPSDSSYAVKFTYERQLADFLNASDTADLPTEWLEPIHLNLAVRLGSFCGKSEKAQSLMPMAEKSLNLLLSFDTEKQSVRFGAASR